MKEYDAPMVGYASDERVSRQSFIRKTYNLLALSLLAFAFLEYVFFSTNVAQIFVEKLSASRYSWFLVIGGFMILSYLATAFASNVSSQPLQYFGLGLYIFLEAIIFCPLLYMVRFYGDATVLPAASIITGMLFLGLTIIAFTTGKDFSFLRSILVVGGFVLLGVIICSALFGFQLGIGFSAIMVVFAGIAILHDTSNVIHNYDTSQHVAAALSLFASVAMLLFYIIRLLMQLNSRD